MNTLLNLHFDVRGDLLEAARQCEEDVFLEAFGNTRSQLEDEYGPYNDQSVFVAVTDDSGEVYGSARLIIPGSAGNKTINDISREPWQVDGQRVARAAQIDLDSTWDLATCGVHRKYRRQGLLVAMAMYHAFMKSTRVNEVKTATSMLDQLAYRVLMANGFQFTTLPGTRPAEYLGSPQSTPVYGHWSDIADAQRRLNPDAYRMITLGIGLDGIVLPEESAWQLRPQLVPVAGMQREDRVQMAAA
jgi:hypothetical protein